MKRSLFVILCAIILVLTALVPPTPAQAAGLTIVSKTPSVNALNVTVSSDITVTFSGDINPATVNATSFNVNGSISGRIAGAYTVSAAAVTLNPTNNFQIGETIYVTLTAGIQDTGTNTLASPVTWQFTVTTGAAGASFSTRANFGGANDTTSSLAVGDFNRDGRLDIVYGNFAGVNILCLNDGAGSFSYTAFGDGVYTSSLAAGDFNGDGYFDIVQGNNNGRSKVWFNNGSGGFPTSANLGGAVVDTWALAVGDFNGDGYLDIVQGVELGQSKVWFNNGSGGFNTSANFGGTNDRTRSLAVGDFNGDGRLDIVYGSYYGVTLVCLNNGAGSFSYTSFGDVIFNSALAVGDFNNDGCLDIAQGIRGGQSKVWFNNGDGTFTTSANFGGSPETTDALAAGDFNGDGRLDIAYGKALGLTVVCLNNGAGGFSYVYLGNGTDKTWALAVGDINGDGRLDLVQGIYQGQSKVWFNNNPVIGLQQGAANIVNGGSYDFGSYLFNTNTDAVFTITNTGLGNLTLTIPFTISGADAGQFSISASATSPVAVSGNTTFTVRFTPTSSGSKTAALVIHNNDPVNGAYTITLTGTCFAPGINLRRGASAIVNGGSHDFGSQATGTFIDTVFTIDNTGTSDLVLTLPFTINGANADQFSLISSGTSPVAASGSLTFTIRFASNALGARTATLEIDSNDPVNGAYTVTLTGTGTAAGGGGGGGGSMGDTVYTATMNIMGKTANFSISSSGKISSTAAVTSADGSLSLTLPGGTMALESDGTRLDGLTCNCLDNPPPPPADASIIGLPYNFGPDGAVFVPEITLTFKYDPANLPAGFDECNLKVAWYDKNSGQWVTLECTVDPATNTIKAGISHFSEYAVIAQSPAPAVTPTVTPAVITIIPPAVTITKDVPGPTVTVTVTHEAVTTVTVPAPAETTPPASITTPAGDQQPFFSWPVIMLIMVGVIIVAAIIFVIIRSMIWRHQGM